MMRYDHYKLLGIARDASQAQIKRAYREKVKNCHPDLNPSPRASTAFRAVHEAYRVLSDAYERSIYDHRLTRYYKAAAQHQEEQAFARKYGRDRVKRSFEPFIQPGTPATRVDRYAFQGLHLTGLLFGVALVCGILFGITFQGWPVMTLIFSVLGIAVLPDSIQGLRKHTQHVH